MVLTLVCTFPENLVQTGCKGANMIEGEAPIPLRQPHSETPKHPHRHNLFMRYIVTGGPGFIGSNLADTLSQNHDIIIGNLATGRQEPRKTIGSFGERYANKVFGDNKVFWKRGFIRNTPNHTFWNLDIALIFNMITIKFIEILTVAYIIREISTETSRT